MAKEGQYSYLAEVEEFFLEITRKGVSLSPDDVGVALGWQNKGVPIECVKRGVKKGIAKFLMTNDPEARLPTRLKYYKVFVEEEFQVFQRSRLMGIVRDTGFRGGSVDLLGIATKVIEKDVMQRFERVAKEAINKLKEGGDAGADVSLVLQEVDEFIAFRILEESDGHIRQEFEELVTEKERMTRAKGLEGTILLAIRRGEAVRFVEKVFGVPSLCDEVLRQVKAGA
jgi:hypothetical protein